MRVKHSCGLALPKSYKHFINALLYGRQTLYLEEFKSTLRTKKLKAKKKGD